MKEKIEEILTRGVGEFVDPDNVFRNKLIAKAEGRYSKDIIIKYGVDPTRPDIHLGHAVCFRKLKQLQDLGCKIVFLVGDFTAQIGDPTGKDKTRPEINVDELVSNVGSFLKQISSLINTDDRSLYEWLANSIWYRSVADLSSGNMLEKARVWEAERRRIIHYRGQIPTITLFNLMATLRNITHAKLIDRDMFQERIKKDAHLYMHEMLYPVLQGIDSEIIAGFFGSCDLELGGTDQTFNMLMGRDIMKNAYPVKFEPQATISIKLLEGTDGKEKMSKSLDNYIGITDKPDQMFGKVMSIPDTSIINYFELCTDVPMDKIKEMKRKMNLDNSLWNKIQILLRIKKQELNPRDAKLQLAYEIIKIYHGDVEAQKAKEYFVNTFSKKEIPTEIEEKAVGEKKNILDYIVAVGFAVSKGDARRKMEQGGVSIDGKKISEDIILDEKFQGKVMKVGKKDFVKIKV